MEQVDQRLGSESRIDRKLTVERFSINFRGHKRNGTGNFPCNFQQDFLLPRNSCCSSFKLP